VKDWYVSYQTYVVSYIFLVCGFVEVNVAELRQFISQRIAYVSYRQTNLRIFESNAAKFLQSVTAKKKKENTEVVKACCHFLAEKRMKSFALWVIISNVVPTKETL